MQQNGTAAVTAQQNQGMLLSGSNADGAHAGQMQKLLLAGPNVSQDQAALANAASAALIAQNGMMATGGQILPPGSSGITAQQQLQQAFATASAAQQAEV